MPSALRPLSSGTVMFGLAAFALMGTNYHLNTVNRRLAARAEAAEDSLRHGLSARVGSLAPSVTGYDLARNHVRYDFGKGGKGSVILAFSPKCPACDAIWPLWTDLARKTPSDRWHHRRRLHPTG